MLKFDWLKMVNDLNFEHSIKLRWKFIYWLCRVQNSLL